MNSVRCLFFILPLIIFPRLVHGNEQAPAEDGGGGYLQEAVSVWNSSENEFNHFHKASLWAQQVAKSQSWTGAVISVVKHRLRDFEQARDKESFCPGYHKATEEQREICWLRLVGGVVEFESSFQADEPPFNEGNGSYSVGLLALSTGECQNAPTVRALRDPVRNLICGVNKMAALIAKGHAIDGPENIGAGAYWSTLRPAHRHWDPMRKRWLNLGKKAQIIARTREYKNF